LFDAEKFIVTPKKIRPRVVSKLRETGDTCSFQKLRKQWRPLTTCKTSI
jgi:hypothetical protein